MVLWIIVSGTGMVLLSSSRFGDLRARLVDRVACSGKARPLAESYSRFSRLDLIKQLSSPFLFKQPLRLK